MMCCAALATPTARGTRSTRKVAHWNPPRLPEWKRPTLASVYAITKYTQERLTLTLAPAYGMEGVALRMWNAYGPGQALSNPIRACWPSSRRGSTTVRRR